MLFETFYKEVLAASFVDEAEYDSFMKSLKERLPVTFRLNRTVPNYQKLQSMLARFQKDH